MNNDRFTRAYPPQEAKAGADARYLPFVQGNLVVGGSGNETARFLSGKIGDTLPFAAPDAAPMYLGDLDGAACLAYRADETAVAEADKHAVSLRSLYEVLPIDEYAVAGLAVHLMNWQEISAFCGKCGNVTGETPMAWAKTCTVCGYCVYPVVSPAVLILVHDGGRKILLSHKPGWGNRYSILAGFVEPGETPEECVARETGEEVGLKVTDIEYHGSQPWPYPHQLMLGYTSRATEPSKEITLDELELDNAAWFDVDDLPELPGKLSLSRQLIDAWVARVRRENG